MSDGYGTPATQNSLTTDAYGSNSNKVPTVAKMLMGPTGRKNKKKYGALAGSNRLPVSMRKGM